MVGKTRMSFLVASFTILATTIQPSTALNVVVFNNGGTEALALCTAKRCAAPRRNNDETTNVVSFVSSSADGYKSRVRRLMYGREDDDLEKTRPPPDERVRLVSTTDEIADALQSADAFVVTANESPVDAGNLASAFSFASASLKHVLLISRQDASSGGGGGGGFFGGGRKDFKKGEDNLRSLVTSKGSAALSVLRCGTLKGGGAGYSNMGGRVEGCEDEPEIGLSANFYNTNFDLANAMTTVSHDRFTLGASIMKGDPNKMPNAFMASAKKDSIDASPTDTNMCTAAVVATSLVEMCHENPSFAGLEISLGTEKSEELPTFDELVQKVKELS